MNAEELEKAVARHEMLRLETACAFKKCPHRNRTRVLGGFVCGFSDG